MIGKVADIILMAEACAEGHCIIGLSFLTPRCNGAPRKVIPKEKMSHDLTMHNDAHRYHLLQFTTTAVPYILQFMMLPYILYTVNFLVLRNSERCKIKLMLITEVIVKGDVVVHIISRSVWNIYTSLTPL